MSDDSKAASLPAGSGAESIAAVLNAAGPVVKCVLLQHMRKTGRDAKPHPAVSELKAEAMIAELAELASHHGKGNYEESSGTATSTTSAAAAAAATSSPVHKKHREILTELIQQLNVDTTPGKNGVQGVLGGSFTFLGQYPDQGIVLMARADQFADLNDIDELSVRELKAIIQDNPDIVLDNNSALEKSDLIQAVREAQLPLNPHKLQPPFDDCAVRGDILLMKVADIPENEQGDGDDDPESAMTKAVNDFTSTTAVPNDEFFLDYTMEEYLAFASRTDVVAPIYEGKTEDDSDDEEQGDGDYEAEGDEHENDNEDDDEDYTGEDLPDDDDDKGVFLTLILGEVIKAFRKEHGRGPDSEELLGMRSQVAAKLGLQLPPPVPVADDKKRLSDSTPQHSPSPKRVKFTPDVVTGADNGDDDRKVAARALTMESRDRKSEGGNDNDDGDSKPEASLTSCNADGEGDSKSA